VAGVPANKRTAGPEPPQRRQWMCTGELVRGARRCGVVLVN
jgi:hypothetical protein